MRIACLVLAVVLSGCNTVVPVPMPEPPGQAFENKVDRAEEPVLPDYKPETAAACNAVRLSVDLALDGSLKINSKSSDLEGLKAAAAAKNAACANAPAMVGYAVAPGVPATRRDAVRDVLSTGIVNLALVEVTTE